MLNEAFQEAIEIIEQIERHGYEAYFVGGCVRDSFLKKEIKDIDIATSASPDEIQAIFDRVIPVGLEHGTVVVVHKGNAYEVTTFRQDGEYSDQRHPDEVIFVKNIEDDLKRRDFTINALALNKNGDLIDLFHGREHLENRIIKTVGNPDDRFYEDPLRIVRALRFSSQLGFDIEPNTLESMKKLNKEIETVAVERLTNEFTRFFQGEYVEKGLDYLIETGIVHYIPVFKDHPNILNKIPRPVTSFLSFAEVITLFHFIHQEISIQRWIKAWKCSNQTKREANNLIEALNDYKENGLNDWLIYRLEQKNFKQFIHLVELLFKETLSLITIEDWKKKLPIQSRNDLAIDGHDLKSIFSDLKSGPWMKDLLEKIERLVVEKKLENEKTVIKEWIICHPPEIN